MSHKIEAAAGPLIGKVNILEVTLGQRGMGKSTYQCSRVAELVRETSGQCYVIGHSLGARLPKELPEDLGGGALPIEYHRSIKALDAGLRARPTRWHILAPPLNLSATEHQDTCDQLIEYSIELSKRLRARAYERAQLRRQRPLLGSSDVARDYDGLPCPCIAIIVDEGIAIESAATHAKDKVGRKKKDWFLEWIYSLRHLHTALFYAVQNPTARNWQLLSEATRVIVFRIRHQWAINAVQAAGGTRKEMRAAKRLEPHAYIALGEDPRYADEDEDLEEAFPHSEEPELVKEEDQVAPG